MSMDRVDHVAVALARLPSQCRDAAGNPLPGWEAVITALVTPIQALEDLALEVLLQKFIDNAVGVQLDKIGRKVGQARNGVSDDATYRRYIKARISTNRSRGLIEDWIRISVLVIDDPAAYIHVFNLGNASAILSIEAITLDEEIGTILFGFLVKAAATGVRLVLVASESEPSETYTAATPSTHLSGAHLAGVTTLTVDSTEGYPSTGTLSLSEGTAVAELATYTGKTATTFTGVSALANNHPDGAAVALVDATDTTGMANGGFLDGPHAAGATTLVLDDAADFTGMAATGTVVLSEGTAVEETRAYTKGVSPNLTVAALTNNHPDGAAVTSTVAGDGNFPNAGGRLAYVL